ncbi:MAG: pyridoxal phosphate-dependent aminotransferase [Haloarculaceae archaeon]
MEIPPFELERWLARHETDAAVMLGESGVRGVAASRFDTDPGRLDYVTPTNGDPELRERIAERYGRSPGAVVCTCGTQEANLLAFLTLQNETSHAVVVTPAYQSLAALPDALGSVSRVELSPPDWRLDPDDVAAAMTPDTALVVLANPNNPTGRVHDAETVRAVYETAADRGAYLLCDEAYRDLLESPPPAAASLGAYGISTGSVTKAHGLAGTRFGWLVGPPEVAAAAWGWKDYTTISPGRFGQHLAAQALAPDREATLLSEHRDLAARNRDLVGSFLDAHGLSWHEPATVTGFPTVPAGFHSGRSFCERVVEEESVLLVPGGAFGHPDRFRVGFGCETERLREGLDRLESFLDRHV